MMKTIKLILLSLMIIPLGAQELDKEFLGSLPDDIKKDLEDKNARQELNSQETYRPYLYSSKLRQTEELLVYFFSCCFCEAFFFLKNFLFPCFFFPCFLSKRVKSS